MDAFARLSVSLQAASSKQQAAISAQIACRGQTSQAKGKGQALRNAVITR